MDYFGVVILNYNASEQTISLINNINNVETITELIKIIVDNNSNYENRLELIEFAKMNNYRIIAEDDILNNLVYSKQQNYILLLNNNYGYAKGNNYGLRLATLLGCKYTIISNNDIILTEPVIKKLSLNFDNELDVGLVGPKVVGLNGALQSPYKKRTFAKELLELMFYPFIRLMYRLSIFNRYNEKYPYAVMGCFLMLKTDVINEIGYFDENTFLYAEELILAERLMSKEYKTIYDETVSIKHIHSYSIDKLGEKAKFKFLLQSDMYYYKNYLAYSSLKIFILKGFRKIFFYFTRPIILAIKNIFKIKLVMK